MVEVNSPDYCSYFFYLKIITPIILSLLVLGSFFLTQLGSKWWKSGVKLRFCRFQQFCDSSTHLLPKDFQKQDLFCVKYVRLSKSIISEILKLRGWFFFWKYSKFIVDSKNTIKSMQKAFSFLYNCIWSGSGKFSPLWRLLLVWKELIWCFKKLLKNEKAIERPSNKEK